MTHIRPIAITVFFVIMMGLLAHDHIIPRLTRGDAIALSTVQMADGYAGMDDYLTVQVNGRHVGSMRLIARSEPDGFASFMVFELQARGAPPTRLTTAARLNQRLELDDFEARVVAGDDPEPVLRLAGHVEGLNLLLRLESETGSRAQSFPLRAPITMNVAAEPFIRSDAMEIGQAYSLEVFDPVFGLRAHRMRIELIGTETRQFSQDRQTLRIVEATLSGARVKMWIDELGEIVRREIRIGGAEQTPGSLAAPLPELVIRLDRIDDVRDLLRYPGLRELPPVPRFTAAELQGPSTGEPFQATGLLALTLAGALQSTFFAPPQPGESPDAED